MYPERIIIYSSGTNTLGIQGEQAVVVKNPDRGISSGSRAEGKKKVRKKGKKKKEWSSENDFNIWKIT